MPAWNLNRLLNPTGVLIVTVILLGSISTVLSQINTGTIVGVVRDAQEGVIPGVSVTVTHQDLGVSATLVTNETGVYVASALRPGTYEVRAELLGFKTAVRRNVPVSVQSRVEVNFTLQLGELQDVVDVVDVAVALQTETADKGTVVSNKEITDLPLDGRRYSDLILLTPGAVPAPGVRSNPREARLNVDGNFSLQNYFALGGVDNNTFTTNAQERSPQAVQPPPDALQEFRIQSRTYDAEFGWSQGAVINAELKSGTNAFHGSVFYFHRNDNLNANSFFANRAGIGKAEELRHQYGGLIGGPIVRDKTFFFFNYQRTDARKGTTTSGTVPTPQMKQGIFAGDRTLTLARNSDGTPVYPEIVPCVDEVNQRLNLSASRTDGLPCLDPAGQRLVELYPDPNFGKFNFFSAPDIPLEQNSFDIRLDHNISARDILYGSYSFYQVETIVERGPLPNPLATGGFTGESFVRGQLVGLTWNHVFDATLLNNVRLGFNRIFTDTAPVAPSGNAGPEFGLEGLPGAFAFGLPPIRVSGYSFLGTSEWRPQYQVSQVYQVMDNLSYVRGNHSTKFGFEYKRAINNFLDIMAPNGRYIIPNFWTGDGVANLLLGNLSTVQATTDLVPHNFMDGYMFYAQDSWKVNSDLTINYGLRYEYFTPMQERNDLTSNFDPSANGGRGALVTLFPESFPEPPCDFDCVQRSDVGGIFGKTLVNPDRNNFAPRLGFSYRASEDMVLRGGYAIFYQAMDRIGSSAVLQLNPPQLVDFVGAQVSSNQPPQMLLRDRFPEVSKAFNPLTIDLRGRDFDEVAPYSQQYSFGPQFRVLDDVLLDVAYVGQVTRKIRKLRRLNQGIIVDPAAGIVEFPFADWGRLSDYLISDGNANYNSLQVQLRKGFSRGYAFNLAYTWGKALGNTQDNLSQGGGTSAVRPQNAHDLDADYGRLVFDQSHRLVFNWVWELPLGVGQPFLNSGPTAHILGGWQLNGIWASTSGSPLGIDASDRSNTFSQNARANCVGDPRPSGFEPSVDLFFEPSAFAQPAPFTFGNCGVANLSSWALHSFDFSIFKNFKLPLNEQARMQFRAEFFNAFNTPQFNVPETSVNSGIFGQTDEVRDPEREGRVIQFGLKILF